jgi:hypothetical protein|tara:strand:+ start:942 stop:1517 length:576 start_codon:yes stop_codon:yes gene_type:complete
MINLKDYIKCYENIIDKKLCAEIMKEFTEAEDIGIIKETTGIKDTTTEYYRVVGDFYRVGCYIKRELPKDTGGEIFDAHAKILKSYEKEFNHVSGTGDGWTDTGFHHLIYKGSEKGECKEHVDHTFSPRVLSCSIILNDNYEGGDFSFFGGEHIIPKKAGSAVIFPSNFCYPHAVTPVNNGVRHSVITWFN